MSRRDNAEFAELSSATADTWVTVTSSSTPSAPMTMPASNTPRGVNALAVTRSS